MGDPSAAGGHPSGPPGARGGTLLTRASFVLAVFAVVWFGFNLVRPRDPSFLLWLPSPLAAMIAAVACWRASRSALLPAPTRRFWRHQSITTSLVTVGALLRSWDTLSGRVLAQEMSVIATCVFAVGMLVALYGMYRLPLGVSSRGERLRLGLDAGTVMLAATVFLWHFVTRPRLASVSGDTTFLFGSHFTQVLIAVAVFAIAKMILTGSTFVDGGSLRLLAAGLLVGAVGRAPDPLWADKPYLAASQMFIPMAMMFAAMAAERQRVRGSQGGARAAEKRPFSVLPYAAVAAVDGLLLVVAWSHGSGEGVVAAAAVVLTAAVVFRQITAFRENSRLLARLDFSATHDALTGLPNRALFNTRLAAALAADATERRIGVALIDLDEFKPVNDTLGHGVGDALLVAVGQRLRDAVRAEDTVARLGGDEFVVIFTDVDAAAADLATERLLAALATPVVAEGHELPVRASIGVADGRTGDDPNDLLRRADIAMYEAKKAGGTSYVHFTPTMAGGLLDHARLGAELAHALADDQLFMEYQPIIALDGERLVGVEALVRWAHPVHGTLVPTDFLPLAERTGEILPLGRWAVREACRQVVAWSAAHGWTTPEVLHVSVSVRELSDRRFVAEVAAELAEAGLDPHRLVIGITETSMVDVTAVLANLDALRGTGVRISLDDFGTGQATLSLLQDFPVDELKLDRSFTQTALARPGSSVAAAVIRLADTFGLHAIAEGVETAEQAEHLRTLGYRGGMGPYFAEPMSAAGLDKILAGTERVGLAV